jgi:hypothetical protein
VADIDVDLHLVPLSAPGTVRAPDIAVVTRAGLARRRQQGGFPQLTAHHLAGAFGYADAGPVSGTFTATEPFPIRIDLDALV